jgi:hypothetical protein
MADENNVMKLQEYLESNPENRALVPPGGTGDDLYGDMGAIDPREVSPEAMNAGALTDEELMMAEEFMNALPPEAQGSFMDRLINDPRATMKSVIDTLGQMFGGDSGSMMDDYMREQLDRSRRVEPATMRGRGALGGIGSGNETLRYNFPINPNTGVPYTDSEIGEIRRVPKEDGIGYRMENNLGIGTETMEYVPSRYPKDNRPKMKPMRKGE